MCRTKRKKKKKDLGTKQSSTIRNAKLRGTSEWNEGEVGEGKGSIPTAAAAWSVAQFDHLSLNLEGPSSLWGVRAEDYPRMSNPFKLAAKSDSTLVYLRLRNVTCFFRN